MDWREIEDLGLISFDEVTQHNSVDDCWMVIGGQVLDVTEFIAFHPGGQTILQGCGQEASELFATRPMGSGMSDKILNPVPPGSGVPGSAISTFPTVPPTLCTTYLPLSTPHPPYLPLPCGPPPASLRVALKWEDRSHRTR